jgi:exonuclease SbcD
MRLLHTADWHLGARLVERDRLPEQAAFLDWLIVALGEHSIDALLVSGDIFDAANPPQEAVALYYDFVRRVSELKHVTTIITGGNHDSAALLNAPRDLLRFFNVHVFGSATDDLISLPGAVIAPVPYLRERDLRESVAGESLGQAHEQVRRAILSHYARQREACEAVAKGRPIIAMGHLTVVNAKRSESERDIHIGNLGAVGAEVFDGFHYTALGHLHRPQIVPGSVTVRYSGSPLPLSFSEAEDEKSVVLIESNGTAITGTTLLAIPHQRRLMRVVAERDKLEHALATLPEGAWTEVTVRIDAPEPNLDRLVRELAAGRIEIIKILAELPEEIPGGQAVRNVTLQDLQPREVFRQLLAEKNLEDPDLLEVFDELVALHEATAIA